LEEEVQVPRLPARVLVRMALQWGQILMVAGVMAASVAIATCVWLWRAHKGRARILPTTKEGRPL